MPIRRNLWLFLRKMQQRRRYYEPLWIDAICINQSMVQEVNHQVSRMGKIYGGAREVFVWLGEADDTSDIAMQKLKMRKPLDVDQANFNKIWTQQQARSVLALCERNYWRRMWIIQEVVLARDIVIHCGSLELRWDRFIQLLKDLQAISRRGRELHTPCAYAILWSPAMALAKVKMEWVTGYLPPLRLLLQTYYDHESTDVRDRVYALFGIASTAGIVIDYHKSAKDVLIDVYLYERDCSIRRLDKEAKARAALFSFGTLLRKLLKVSFTEGEMDFYLNHERLRGVPIPEIVFATCDYHSAKEMLHCLDKRYKQEREKNTGPKTLHDNT